MRLVKSSNTEVSGASEVPQSHGNNWFFRKSSCCVFFSQKLILLVKIRVNREDTKVQATTGTNIWCLKKIEKSMARTGCTLIRHEFAYISILSENDHFFAKIAKNIIFGRTSSFFTFRKNKKKTTPDFLDEKPKTDLSFEIGQPQWKCQRTPTLQSMVNPGVVNS